MAWPSSTAFTAGQTAGVSTSLNAMRTDILNTNIFAVKAANETRTSATTITSDLHLLYNVQANGTYLFELDLVVGSAASAAGDIKLGFIFPTAAFCNFHGMGPDIGLASGTVQTGQWQNIFNATSGVTTLSFGASATTVNGIHVRGILSGVTGTGNLRLQWAQDSSNGNATTLYSGSYMQVKQVA